MTTTTTLGPKDVAEKKVVLFDFTNELALGETLASVQLSISVLSGADPACASVLDGLATITSPIAYQRVAAGLKGVTYHLRAVGTSSTGNIHTIAADMAVEKF